MRVDVAAAEACVRRVLRAFPDAAGAYLFGSALELCRPDSDIDVGVLRTHALDPRADAWADLGFGEEIADALGKLEGHPFHVSVLSLRAPFLAFEAIHGGRAVLVRDEDLVTDFVERVALRYRDDYPSYRAALEEIGS